MGSGGVGGYFGAVLARGGEDVTFVARGEHLAAINREGLRIESTSAGEFVVRAPAVDAPALGSVADLVLFCVKSYHNEQAIRTIAPAVASHTSILTLQNGIGSGDELGAAFGRDKVLLGATYVDASRKAPGLVAEVGGDARIVFGEPDGGETDRAIRVRDTLLASGIDVHLSSNVLKDLWDKLLFICVLSGMTCIARGSLAEVVDTPETLELAWRVMREAEQVARAKGVGLDEDIVESTMAWLQEKKHDIMSSMHVDLQAGNPLERSVLNGAVSAAGKEVGVATPANDFITACLTVADNRARSKVSS